VDLSVRPPAGSDLTASVQSLQCIPLHVPGHGLATVGRFSFGREPAVPLFRAQSSRLVEFGGLGMSLPQHARQLGNVLRDEEYLVTDRPRPWP